MTSLTSTRPIAATPNATSTERFVGIILLTCVFLQRFGVRVAVDTYIPLATPIVVLTAIWQLHTGALLLNARRAMLFFALMVCAVVSTSLSLIVNISPGITGMTSYQSLAYGLLVTSFAALSFAEPMREERFYKLILACLTVVAVAGILEFVAQFFGVLAFSFKDVVPDWLLMEDKFGTFQPVEFGSDIFRGNGFFLLEPSFMGQFMALAIMIEMTGDRRPLRLLLYVTGILTAVSGTGMVILAAFVVTMAVTTGKRAIVPLLLVAISIAVIFIVLQMVLPEITERFVARSGEANEVGSSGNVRFIATFYILEDVFGYAPWSILTGVGPGIADHLPVTYDYAANTITKWVVDYGIIGFVLYMTMILSAQRNHRQNLLLVPLLVMLLLTAQNQQFSIVVFPVLLIITVARFKPTSTISV